MRVRQIIPYLGLEADGIKNILPTKTFTERYDTVTYPKNVVKKKLYSRFGLDFEASIAVELSKIYKTKFIGGLPSGVDSRFDYLSKIDRVECDEYILKVVNFITASYPPNKITKVSYGEELVYTDTPIIGHPDLLIYISSVDVVIYDVKVFARSVGNISKDIRSQIGMYVALARTKLTCNKVGVIMPWKRDPCVKTYDVTKWDSNPLLECASRVVDRILSDPFRSVKWGIILEHYKIGSHIEKNELINNLEYAPRQIPFQIFLYGNTSSFSREDDGRKKLLKKGRMFENHKVWIHAPYNLVLCTDYASTNGTVAAAKMYMQDALALGCKGVVFHVGHSTSENDGIAALEKNIRLVLEATSPDTPFILETPCGNKNELLSDPEIFSEFISRFDETKVGICVDTCHVFVDGYDPLDYITRLGPQKDRICLLHLNGSRKKKGAKADGHAHVATIQNISDYELIGMIDYADTWKIDMVTE
jgi:endonuclease IV